MTSEQESLDAQGDSHALRLERLHSRQSILENQVKSSIDALRHSVDNMQLEVRSSSSKMAEFAEIQFHNAANRTTLDEMRQEMARLGDKVEQWLRGANAAQDQRWRDADRNRDRWREQHEAENENTRIDLTNAIKETSDKMRVWSGIGFSAVLLGGVVVSAVVWGLNMRFESQKDSVTDAKLVILSNQAKIDKLTENQRQIELHLASGTFISREPYDPSRQKPQANP
jgi:hypothetical protein